MIMTKVSIESEYKFNFVATRDAVQNAFDNAGLVLALREATAVVKTLSQKMWGAQLEYKSQLAKTENILFGIQEYQKQNRGERKKIAKDVVEYWFEKVTTPIQPVKNKTIVYFSPDHELYCESKIDHCYRLEVNSQTPPPKAVA